MKCFEYKSTLMKYELYQISKWFSSESKFEKKKFNYLNQILLQTVAGSNLEPIEGHP